MLSVYDHPDYHAFVRAMRTDDSDLIRLVVADWLEEREEYHRASYIRSRCQVRVDHEHPVGLGAGVMWLVHDEGFPVEIELAPSLDRMQFTTSGGFVTAVRSHLADWLTHGPDLCRRHPVREVVVTDRRPVASVWGGSIWCVPARLSGSAENHTLPPCIRPHMPIGELPVYADRPDDFFSYRTYAAAQSAMNAAALRWAEAEADRPAPTEETQWPLPTT